MSNVLTARLRRPPAATEPAAVPVVLPRINLLPTRIRAGQVRIRVLSALGAAAVLTVVIIALLAFLASSRQASEQRRLDAAQQRNTQLQREAGTLAGVRKTYTDVDTARATLRAALSTEVLYSRLLAGLSTHVPPTIQVSGLSYAQTVPGTATSTAAAGTAATPTVTTTGSPAIGTIKITGITATHDEVATWLRALATQPGVADVVFSTSTKEDKDGRTIVTFQSAAVITAAALSGRYAGADGGLR